MIRVFGCSDDLVECEGAEYPNDEIGCFERDVLITFSDGTTIMVGYPKPGIAVWWIEVERRGTAEQTLTRCFDEDADIYSDIFEIDSDVEHVSVIPKGRNE